MVSPVTIGFAFALASVSQAMTLVPLQNSNSLIVDIREDRGEGFTRFDSQCVRTPAQGSRT